MKNTNWTKKCDNICKTFIVINLENNSFYSLLNREYQKDKDTTINAILKCYENFGYFYSLYTIMDKMEYFLANNKNIKIYDICESESFVIE